MSNTDGKTVTTHPMSWGFKLVHKTWIGSVGLVERVEVIRLGVIIDYAETVEDGAFKAQMYALERNLRVPSLKRPSAA
jgi:hypothetical protein